MAWEKYMINRAGRSVFNIFSDPSKRAGRVVYRDSLRVRRINRRIHKLENALNSAIEKHYLDPVLDDAKKAIKLLAKEVKKLLDILLKEEFIELKRIQEVGEIGRALLPKLQPPLKDNMNNLFNQLLDQLEKEVKTEFSDLAELSETGTIQRPGYAIKLNQESLDQEETYLGRMERRAMRRAVSAENASFDLARQVNLPDQKDIENKIRNLFKRETSLAKYEAKEVHDTLLELIYALNHLRLLQNRLESTKQKGFPPLEIDNMLIHTQRIYDQIMKTITQAVQNSRALLSEEYRGEQAVKAAA